MQTLRWHDDHLDILDQTCLPLETSWVSCHSLEDVVEAIASMRVRGAPLIGVVAAFGMAIAARRSDARDSEALIRALEAAGEKLRASRPTAVNLAWAIDRVLLAARERLHLELPALVGYVALEAQVMAREDLETNRHIGQSGLEILRPGLRILTHCSTGTLATVGHGTALGVIRTAHEAGLAPEVTLTETRPRLQGARLNAWECQQLGIPYTLIPDSAAAFRMQRGLVDVVITGADRITSGGDVANKVGTYMLALCARAHRIPFYVAAPLSTVDLALDRPEQIPIEERDPREVTHLAEHPVAAPGTSAWNPAFDVTPRDLITGIITERGVLTAPYRDRFLELMGQPVRS
ncbi:MAG: S-methyl-5-thioribose-1-phosphate isomerase [bacterium]|nr:S-methyl-5-thioribose-1-phosphate isomerase [bacterium]